MPPNIKLRKTHNIVRPIPTVIRAGLLFSTRQNPNEPLIRPIKRF